MHSESVANSSKDNTRQALLDDEHQQIVYQGGQSSNHGKGLPIIPAAISPNLTESPIEEASAKFPSSGISPVAPSSMKTPTLTHSTTNLKSQLDKAFQKSPYDVKTSFLPMNKLECIINRANVFEYCSAYAAAKLAPQQTREILEYVFGPQTNGGGFARQVFAVLVLMDEPDLIPSVVREDIRDSDLPLVKCNEVGTEYQLARRSNMSRDPIKCFTGWTPSQKRAFDAIQFQVKAPVFEPLDPSRSLPRHDIRRSPRRGQSGSGSHQADDYVATILDNRAVLPFTSFDGKDQIVAGSSKVVRLKIHHAHHTFNHQGNEYFAMKSLEARDTKSQLHFLLEVKALMKIRAKERPHLVDLLTTFKYDNKYHLLFRWASGGNLSDLWNKPRANLPTYKSVCWLAQQCWGIADGLHGIHNAKLSLVEISEDEPVSMYLSPAQQSALGGIPWLATQKSQEQNCGRHGDIKPPNILWFQQDANDYDRGVLKISDFGLTTFHTDLTTKISPKEQDIDATWTYAAPEWDLKEDVSRPFDLWSLGCVYLEFITWELCSVDGIREFRDKRSQEKDARTKFVTDAFYCLLGVGDERCAIVKQSVVEWTQYLRERPQCTIYISDLLDYIMDHMIVVEKSQRDKSSLVRRKLDGMFRQCQTDRDYALSSVTSYGPPLAKVMPGAKPSSKCQTSKEEDKKVPRATWLERLAARWS